MCVCERRDVIFLSGLKEKVEGEVSNLVGFVVVVVGKDMWKLMCKEWREK